MLPSIQQLTERQAKSLESRIFYLTENDGTKVISDKVYGLFIEREPSGSTYGVSALYGSRSAATLSSATKASGLDLAGAKKALGKAGSDRLKKNYTECARAKDIVGAKSTDAFILTRSMASKLPAAINDGYTRPTRAKTWGCTNKAMATFFIECGGDCIFSDLVLFPTAIVRQVALECQTLLDQMLPKQDSEAEFGAMLGLWEGEPEGYSMLGQFVMSDGNCLERNPLAEASVRHGGLVVGNDGDDNYPGASFAELECIARQEPKLSARVQLAAEALLGWVDDIDDIMEHDESGFVRQVMARKAALAEAAEIDLATAQAKPLAPRPPRI